MRRATWVGFAGAVVAATAAGSAHAAPPWSEPRAVGPAAPMVSRATIDFGSGGSALLSRRVTADPADPARATDRLATLTPDGTLVEHGRLRASLAAPPLVFGNGRVALLHQSVLSKPDARTRRLRLSLSVGSTARPAGRGRPRRLTTYTPFPSDAAVGPAIAAGPRGEIAIVWMAFRGDEFGSGRFRVRLRVRRPNGRFDRPRTVASGAVSGDRNSYSVAVAFGARRDVVVAYAVDPLARRASSISVRTLRRGRRFDRPRSLGTQDGLVQLHVAASRIGRTVVAWATQDSGEEANMPSVVRAAIRGPRAARFAPTRLMDPGELNARVPGRLRLAMAPGGTAVLAWSNARGPFNQPTFPVRMAIAEAGRAFGPVVELAAAGAVGDVAVRDDGAALVTWTDPNGYWLPVPLRQTLAAFRAGPGLPLGPPELIAPSSPSGQSDRYVAAGFNPRTGSPTAVWPASNGSDVLQLAVRAG